MLACVLRLVEPLRNPRLAFLRALSSANSQSISLPPELWEYIAGFLDLKDLSRIYLVNRSFYHAFIRLNYRSLDFPDLYSRPMAEQVIAILVALRNPDISRKVFSLSLFGVSFVDSLISSLTLGRLAPPFPANSKSWSLSVFFPGSCKTKEAFEQAIQSSLSMVCNLTHLTLDLSVPTSVSDSRLLDALLTACSHSLVHLTLCLSRVGLTTKHRFGLGITYPHLRSLHVKVSANLWPYTDLLTELRGLIPENGGCMEELLISLDSCQSPLGDASFGSLRKLIVEGDPTAMPSILPIVTTHQDTLQEITLGITPSQSLRHLVLFNTNVLTSLSLYADPLQERMFPFLSQCTCLRTLKLLHFRHLGKQSSVERTPLLTTLLRSLPTSLNHLTLPGLLIDLKLFPSIFQLLSNISSLVLSDCYLGDEEFRALCRSRKGIVPPRLLGEAWELGFENLLSQLNAPLEEGLDASPQEPLSKLFDRTSTFAAKCCQPLV